MKKIISIIAAAALTVSCFSCSDDEKKKEEPKPTDTAVNEDTGDTLVTEPVYREYSEEDFRTVEVSLTNYDKEPPVDISFVDISGLDFGEKVPICNKAENVQGYYSSGDSMLEDDEEHDWFSYTDNAEKGVATNCCTYDGKFYIVVEYKPIFHGRYDFSLFRYDESSGKTEELYSWSSSDINDSYVETPVLANGKMFYAVFDLEDYSETAYSYDLISGDVKIIYENSGSDEVARVCYDNIGCPSMIVYSKEDYIKDTMRYDADTESFISVKADDMGGDVVTSNVFSGVPFYLVKPDDTAYLDMVSEYYRVSLSYPGGVIIYGDDKMFIVKNYTLIHMYDLEKMEHYILDVHDMGDIAAYSGGFLFLGSMYRDHKIPFYCIKPEFGIVYTIAEGIDCNRISVVDDKVVFNSLIDEIKDIELKSSYVSYGSNKIEKAYAVTIK